MTKKFLLSATCALALLIAAPAPVSAQQLQSLPLSVQVNLQQAAAQGPNRLLNVVYNSVQTNPQLAQAIANHAIRLQPNMSQTIVTMSNTALRDLAAGRVLQPMPEVSNAISATSTSGLSIGGWTAVGVAAAAGGAYAAFGTSGSGDNSGTTSLVEYTANYALPLSDTRSANNKGGTGAGALVAVADTGIDSDHPELVGQFTGGLNVLNGGATPSDIEDDPAGTGHGTFVSGIIAAKKNFLGMHGVAYDSQILPIRFFDNSTAATAAEAAVGVAYAIAQDAEVFNGSYGYTSPPPIVAIEAELDAYESAIGAGMIMVFAAGNDSLPDPAMPAAMPFIQPANDSSGLYTTNTNARNYSATASQLLAVVSVDDNGVISSFSNRCGVAAAWCLAAGGGAVYSTTVGGSYGIKSGTSFAAPVVAGAAAALIDLYPSLTAAQVVTRILTTAADTGIYANTAVYGQGLLNMTAASAFIAPAMVPMGSSLAGPGAMLSASQFQLSSPFGDGLQRALATTTFKPVDTFDGAAIATPASALVAAPDFGHSLTDRVRRFGRSVKTEQFEQMGGGSVSWRQVPGNDRYEQQVEARVTTAFSGSTSVTVGYMDDPALGFGLMADGSVNGSETLANGAFLTPYLGFAQDGMNLVATTKVGDVTVRAGSFTGRAEDDRSATAFGAAGELSFSPYGGSSISVQAGFVREDSTFLGGDNNGAFALGESTTSFAGLSARLPVAAKTEIVGSFFLGSTQVDAPSASLLGDMSGVMSDAFSIGLIQHDTLVDGDRFGLLINQPLRVASGSANLRLPGGVASDYSVSYSNVNANLAPSGREIDLEAFYRAPLDAKTDVNASLMYRHQPNHVADAEGEVQTLVRWQRRY